MTAASQRMNSGVCSARFPALGSTAVVVVAQATALERARSAVAATIDAFDVACSRFREDSELTALNQAAPNPMTVSPLLLDAVNAALRAAQLTGGDVDPTVGEALVALGYDADFESLRERPVVRFAAVPGWRSVKVDPVTRTIRLDPGVKLDLGATAKALAADRAAGAAHAESGCGVLVSLGGDIAIAGPSPQEGWRIRVTDDHRSGAEAPGQWITLRSGGLATSSTAVRRWRAAGHTMHHLVDPATGEPTRSTWRTVSVTAGSCLDANIASTASIIRGERAVAWLEDLALPSRLVDVDGRVRHVAGWPREGDDLPVLTEARA